MVQEFRHASSITTQQSSVVKLAPSETNGQSTFNVTVHSASSNTGTTVLLGTALVKVALSSERTIQARALIDPGSEVSCIMESLMQKLKAPHLTVAISIIGLGTNQSYSKGITSVFVNPRIVTKIQIRYKLLYYLL